MLSIAAEVGVRDRITGLRDALDCCNRGNYIFLTAIASPVHMRILLCTFSNIPFCL